MDDACKWGGVVLSFTDGCRQHLFPEVNATIFTRKGSVYVKQRVPRMYLAFASKTGSRMGGAIVGYLAMEYLDGFRVGILHVEALLDEPHALLRG